MQLKVFDKNGKEQNKKVKLEETIFKAGINEYLMNLAVLIYLGNRRQSNAHTKNRSEVRGGGAKPWRQKGTGRARHGSIRSPIWKGGGVVFGPTNEKSYKRKMTKKMKQCAIRSTFSFFAREKRLIIIEDIEIKDKHLTKQLLKINDNLPVEGKVLYIQRGDNKKLYLASRNLKNVDVVSVDEINVYELLKHNNIVILQNSLEKITKYWKKEKKAIEHKKAVTKKMGKSGKTDKDLSKISLPERIKTALEKAGIKTVEELKMQVGKGEKIAGIGEKSLEKIKKVIKV